MKQSQNLWILFRYWVGVLIGHIFGVFQNRTWTLSLSFSTFWGTRWCHWVNFIDRGRVFTTKSKFETCILHLNWVHIWQWYFHYLNMDIIILGLQFSSIIVHLNLSIYSYFHKATKQLAYSIYAKGEIKNC